jgi:inhibitor of cysteine peptidase
MRRLILSTILFCACLLLTLMAGNASTGSAVGGKDRPDACDLSKSSQETGKEMLAANEKKEDAGMTDPEKPIATSPGQEFNISLKSNRTTGFLWQLASPVDEAVVKLVGSDYKAPQSRLQGAGGTEVWTFRATGRGQTTIAMKYVRPWEKNVPPARTATFKIVSQ